MGRIDPPRVYAKNLSIAPNKCTPRIAWIYRLRPVLLAKAEARDRSEEELARYRRALDREDRGRELR
jgi:hypothetical protein